MESQSMQFQVEMNNKNNKINANILLTIINDKQIIPYNYEKINKECIYEHQRENNKYFSNEKEKEKEKEKRKR